MDFWRIWRLINRRIYLVIGLALVAAVLVVIGIFIQNQMAGVTADARLTVQQAPSSMVMSSSENPTLIQADPSKRISELTTQLKGNNNIFVQAAELLRKDEEGRKREVNSILERNQYFAPYDTKIADTVDQQVQEGIIPPASKQAEYEKRRRDFRLTEVARLAAPRDSLGTFAQDGVKQDASVIANIYREQVDAKPVVSLMDTESVRQFDNQIQLLGNFGRESEALLYLNMLTVAFLDHYATLSQAGTRTNIAGLLKKKEAAVQERVVAVRNLAAFKNRSEFAVIIGPQDNTVQSFQSLENRLAELRAQRDGAREAFNNAVQNAASTPKTITVSLPAEENPRYKELQGAVDRAEVEFNRLTATRGDNDPELKTARETLSKLKIARNGAKKPFTVSQPNPNYLEAQRSLNTARSNVATAEVTMLPHEQQYNKLLKRLLSSPVLQAEYSKLMGELDQVSKNLAMINQNLQKLGGENILSSQTGTILITRAYVLPSKNTLPNGVKLLLYATTLALILGVALVIGQDALDNSVRTKKDAEEILGLPVAGEIPAQLPDPRRAPRVTYLDPLSPTSEAYRLLRTDILFTQLENPFRSLLVATVKPGQGATTTVANLAITMAQAGKKVILVDSDLRHPSLHQVFSLSNERGLTTLLAGASIAIDEVLQRTEIENLLVLTSGPLPLNPSELIGSPQMRELHKRLKDAADVVLFDAPSTIAFSDTSILASFVDSTLLVIRAGDVPRGVVEQVKGMLTKAHANLIGVVLNAAPSESVDSVHYHNQYYPRLKSTTQSVPSQSYSALDDDDRFEHLAAEAEEADDDDDMNFLVGGASPSLRNPGVGAAAEVNSEPVVEPPRPVSVQLPVQEPPVARPTPVAPIVAIPTSTSPPSSPLFSEPVWEAGAELPRIPEPPRTTSEPLKTNWGTSPMVAPSELPIARAAETAPAPPKPGSPLINDENDNEITFDFDKDDEEDLDDFDEDFDDFDEDEGYDDGDYADDAARLPQRKKPTGSGGILGWFKRGR